MNESRSDVVGWADVRRDRGWLGVSHHPHTLEVALGDQYRNVRTITLSLTHPAPWDNEAAMQRLVDEAERIANEHNPPPGWPYGVPVGPWVANWNRVQAASAV